MGEIAKMAGDVLFKRLGDWGVDTVFGPALAAAFASKKPTIVSPFEPPIPATATVKQELHLAESLAGGEPNRVKIARTIFQDKVTELL